MNEFKFTNNQRLVFIAACFNKYQTNLTEVFLNESQRLVAEWLTNHPCRDGDNKESRERLEMLTGQLEKTRNYLKLLPDMAKQQLAGYWKYSTYKRQGWPGSLNEIECFLLELQSCTADLIQPGGIRKSIESDLVESLAWAFVDTFRKKPTTSPDGSFMSFLKHLSENILSSPNGRKVTFGKDLVAGVLKHVKNRLDELDKFQNS